MRNGGIGSDCKKQGRRVDGPEVVDVLWELSYYDFA